MLLFHSEVTKCFPKKSPKHPRGKIPVSGSIWGWSDSHVVLRDESPPGPVFSLEKGLLRSFGCFLKWTFQVTIGFNNVVHRLVSWYPIVSFLSRLIEYPAVCWGRGSIVRSFFSDPISSGALSTFIHLSLGKAGPFTLENRMHWTHVLLIDFLEVYIKGTSIESRLISIEILT